MIKFITVCTLLAAFGSLASAQDDQLWTICEAICFKDWPCFHQIGYPFQHEDDKCIQNFAKCASDCILFGPPKNETDYVTIETTYGVTNEKGEVTVYDETETIVVESCGDDPKVIETVIITETEEEDYGYNESFIVETLEDYNDTIIYGIEGAYEETYIYEVEEEVNGTVVTDLETIIETIVDAEVVIDGQIVNETFVIVTTDGDEDTTYVYEVGDEDDVETVVQNAQRGIVESRGSTHNGNSRSTSTDQSTDHSGSTTSGSTSSTTINTSGGTSTLTSDNGTDVGTLIETVTEVNETIYNETISVTYTDFNITYVYDIEQIFNETFINGTWVNETYSIVVMEQFNETSTYTETETVETVIIVNETFTVNETITFDSNDSDTSASNGK